MFFGSRRATKSVVAAEVAALAALRVASLGDRVGAIVFSDAGHHRDQAARRGRPACSRLLAALVQHNNALRADVPHAPETGLYNEALRRASRLAKHDCLVVLISDGSGADAGDDEARDPARRAQRPDRDLRLRSARSRPARHRPRRAGRGRPQIEVDLSAASCAAASPRTSAEWRARIERTGAAARRSPCCRSAPTSIRRSSCAR